MEQFQRLENTPGSTRLWALEREVRKACEADPHFEATLAEDPLGRVRQRFGAAMMPNEGERQMPLEGGGFRVEFPVSKAVWHFRRPEQDELSDQLLEAVSGGGNSISGPTDSMKG
jgi:hypothetical protein